MAKNQQDTIQVTDRKYPKQMYSIASYDGSGKVDLKTSGMTGTAFNVVNLKMSAKETEELITRLQFALYEAKNGKAQEPTES